jgi:predicted NUDIX family NTP pyrophosphohydrolase
MVAAVIAVLLMYSLINCEPIVFLVHPGGHFFKNNDEGYLGILKELHENNETLLDTALREFRGETGIDPIGDFLTLGLVKQKNSKTINAWAFRNENYKSVKIKSNTFELEWPPHSSKKQQFPEIVKGEFYPPNIGREIIAESQRKFILEFEMQLKNISL